MSMSCRCANCNMEIDEPRHFGQREGKVIPFCDKSCVFQHIRETSKHLIDADLKDAKSMLKNPKTPVFLRRYFASVIIFMNALLARKPREELLRLNDVSRRICADLVEFFMEQKDDEFAFSFGETFKVNFDSRIDAWAAPQ